MELYAPGASSARRGRARSVTVVRPADHGIRVGQVTDVRVGEIGHRLGQACANHADCAVDAGPGGFCLRRSLEQSFPGGYCSISDTRDACEPPHGHFTYLFVSYWFKRCTGDRYCREGYECFPLYGACVPATPVQLEIPEDFDLERDLAPICL